MEEPRKLMDELDVLVQEDLKLVSFKWLSRKFSLSSNRAKQVLQQYVDEKKGGVEVAYLVSGWGFGEPRSFSIQLASSATLEQVKAGLEGPVSCHVYSVQRSLPKDPAAIWSTEFVQSEELFNQPPEVDNCLRDNRFSAVACSLVKRDPSGRTRRVVPPQPAPQGLPVKPSKPLPSAKSEPQAPPKEVGKKEVPPKAASANGEAPGEGTAGDRVEEQAEGKAPGGKPTMAAKAGAGVGVKRKTPGASAVGAGKGPSLSSMWQKAANKKPPAGQGKATADPAKATSFAVAGSADAEIRAMEESPCDDMEDSDNEAAEFALLRSGKAGRKWAGASGRRRRMVEDEEEEEEEKEEKDEENEGRAPLREEKQVEAERVVKKGRGEGKKGMEGGDCSRDRGIMSASGSDKGGERGEPSRGSSGLHMEVEGGRESSEEGAAPIGSQRGKESRRRAEGNGGTQTGLEKEEEGGCGEREREAGGREERQRHAEAGVKGNEGREAAWEGGVEGGPSLRAFGSAVDRKPLGEVKAGAEKKDGGGGGGRQKKIITTIDERGKEITQIVWVNEEGEKGEPEPAAAVLAKSTVPPARQAKPSERREHVAPTERSVPASSGGGGGGGGRATGAKGGTKGGGAKGAGNGGPKKGSIASFFKKKA